VTHVPKVPPSATDEPGDGPAGETSYAAAADPSPAAADPSPAATDPSPAAADPRQAALDEVARKVAACTRCAELVRNRTQTVFGVGNPHARLVFCGEAPGADEDRQGTPFVGRAGQLLTDIIEKGMKLKRSDVYILNILRCRPPGNRNPLPIEAAACREWLDAQLAIIRPGFICCLGAVAAQNLLDTTESIGRLRGRVHDHQGIKVVCTYHPAYLLRNPSAKAACWDDIKLLMREMGLPVPE
jgi:uracil-DNA glycosylase